jgi:hypothetical protein
MAKGNIRLYNTEAEYLLEKDGFELPNVSFVEDSKVVFYNAKLAKSWATMANGVYAVGADGSPVMVEDADESCIGVALITDNQKIMIAKNDATDGTNTKLYWGSNLYQKDVAGITETTDENVAKADFNGKANTAAIIAAYTEYGVEMNSRDMCKVLQDFNAAEDADWYVPSAGQLYEISTNRTTINEGLTAIGGTVYQSNEYWSSSEYGSSVYQYPNGWCVIFSNGTVYPTGRGNNLYVRFIRDLI